MRGAYPTSKQPKRLTQLSQGKPEGVSKSHRIRYAVVAAGLVVGLAACSNPTPTHQPNNKIPTGTVPKSPGGNTGAP
jgi:hypothetical protein